VRQRVDTDAELAHAVGLLENLAVDAPGMQHERRGKPPMPPPTMIAFIATPDASNCRYNAACRSPRQSGRTASAIDSPELYWTNRRAKTVFLEEFDHAGYRMQVGGNRGTCICS
jgi:hypothetical protein